MRFVVIFLLLSFLVFTPQLAAANTAPVADINNGPYEKVIGELIMFDGSTSFDIDGDFLTYAWDFGDGESEIDAISWHVYTAPGIYTVSLTVNDGIEDSTPIETIATITLASSENPVRPENGTEAIQLEPALILILEPEPVEGAEEYRYQYWKQEETIPEPGDGELISEGTIELSISSDNLTPGAQYFWRVRACANIGGCGPVSDPPWSFTYLLSPPLSGSLAPTSDATNLPVEFSWEEVIGAESYLIRGELDFGRGFWGGLFNFISCIECWFVDLAVDFVMEQLGLDAKAIGCPVTLWDENASEEEIPCVDVTTNRDSDTEILATEYIDTACTFTKETKYKWYIATCLGTNAQYCGEFSSKKSFKTNDVYEGVSGFTIPAPELVEPSYDLLDPTTILVVGFYDRLLWETTGEGSDCAHFHRVIITRESDGEEIKALDIGSFNLDFDLEYWTNSDNPPQEKIWQGLDEIYTWNAEPCFIRDTQEIECEGTLSETWKFKTTGAVPLNPESEVINKTQLSWDKVEKAGSYKYQVASDNTFSTIIKEDELLVTQVILSYPDIEPNASYWWHVASCADEEGVICGEWSATQTFTTLSINPPSTPINPAHQGEMLVPGSLSWEQDSGASYYQYRVEYATVDPDETLKGCAEKANGTQLIPEPGESYPITTQTSFYLNERCTGIYNWAVRSCVEETCDETQTPSIVSSWSTLWTFTAKEGPTKEQIGLVPCNRTSNNASTPYNEKETCELKHVGFLLQNILDFVLWKLSLIILAALAVFVGASTYFSFGSPDIITRMRSIFRSYVYGVLVLLFAWLIINIIMSVFGFNITFFGSWYEISF